MAKQTKKATDGKAPTEASKDKICFVVMPFGRTDEEKRWFLGWYHEVIRKAVEDAGYESVLGVLENAPNAINDDLRKHLAIDPMVVVDLGGFAPEDAPNPNVMYELGIRHAFNLPVVLMARKGQDVPFDINNQRAIMERRELVNFEGIRERLRQAIAEAERGEFYKPMDAVKRTALLERAEQAPGQDSVLRTLIEAVRVLGEKIDIPASSPSIRRPRSIPFNWASVVKEAMQFDQVLGETLLLKVQPSLQSNSLILKLSDPKDSEIIREHETRLIDAYNEVNDDPIFSIRFDLDRS